jgi:hypothetical protein
MFNVELRMRALLRAHVVDFARPLALPCAPFPWLVIQDGPAGEDGLRLCEVVWDARQQRFLCRIDDDVDAACDFGDDVAALTRHYEARGWQVRDQGPVARVLGLECLHGRSA